MSTSTESDVQTDRPKQQIPAPVAGKQPVAERVRALKFDKQTYMTASKRAGRLKWLVVLIVIAMSLWIVRRHLGVGPGILAGVRQIEAVTVSRAGPLDVVLDTTGYIVARSTVSVSARSSGTIVELNFEEGEEVKKGDLLARLEDAPARADYQQAKATLAMAAARYAELREGSRSEEIEQARAMLDQAKVRRDLALKELARAEQLKDTIAANEYDRIDAKAKESEANVQQLAFALRVLEKGARKESIAAAAADVDKAKAMVAKTQFFFEATRILAPISGTVLTRYVEPGELVRPDVITTSLYEIAALDKLDADIDIQEQDLAKVRIGQRCLVTTDVFPDRKYEGRLRWLAPVYNRQRGIRQAKVEVLGVDAKLAPDMNCRVRVLDTQAGVAAADGVHVPADAIRRQAGQAFVFVCQDNVARRREVQVGASRGGMVEIRAGLGAGELVLLPGKRPLRHGQAVRPHSRHAVNST